jgi:creatinine amidohydrolase
MNAQGKALRMEEMTVEDMREALGRTRTVLVPLGVTEQHGYHLPLSTDVHTACQTAWRVSGRTGAVVAPPLPYSYSGGSLPGTINVAPQVMALMVSEIIQGLVGQGFRNVLLLLGHAGTENLRALKDLVNLFLTRRPDLADVVVALVPLWEFSPTFLKAFENHDFHAGYIETSLMLYWAPEQVRTDRIVQDEPAVAASLREHQDNYQQVRRPVDDPHVAPRLTQREDIKVGVMGYPEKASAEVGREVCEEMVAGVVALIKKIESKQDASATG